MKVLGKVLIGMFLVWLVGSAFIDTVYKYVPWLEQNPEFIVMLFLIGFVVSGKWFKRMLL